MTDRRRLAGTSLTELQALQTRPSQFSRDPTRAIAEKSWADRLAKRLFFNDFGTYDGRDHSAASAPEMIARGEVPVRKEPDVVELEVE